MDKLTYFKSYIAIVEQGSLKSASDFLNLTPSAVSKHLSVLEQYYGVDLAIRDAKNMRITGEGKTFYQACKGILANVDRAEGIFLQNSHSVRSVLRITVSQVLTQGKFMQMLSGFSQAHPHITLDIRVSNKNLDLIKEDIDFAFRGGKLDDSQMRSKQLFSTKTVLCAANNSVIGLNDQQIQSLVTDRLIIPSYVNLSTLRMYLHKIGIKKPLTEFTSFDDAYSYKNAVLSDVGIGIFLDFFIEKELSEGGLWRIEGTRDFSYKSLDIHMIYHKNVKLANAHEMFKNYVSDFYLREHTIKSQSIFSDN